MDYLIPDAGIIQRCRQATPDDLLSHPASDNKVLRLNEFLVVKSGFLPSEDEARNQMKAFEISILKLYASRECTDISKTLRDMHPTWLYGHGLHEKRKKGGYYQSCSNT
ncbi:hypothetical protein Z517_09923 [Fonsecaea pedrosoi CBS 271.37]|uniref:Uncharacterized protein n=1 Tax=Fonsecaea pedrosoi CBS 271.37 TaxID=1442368 RepID=A0A0D2ETE4_9EURO|nr:uncharacterized protein Z517_09923 [Fonsecaea pedrosoi CBS 271.37]KIW77477.1 hypothetical protein Z517_09923 [Fonsecaea pedrosoi CBS 271.37]